MAQRGALGIARTGGTGETGSGDLLLAFSTGNTGLPPAALIDVGPDEITVRSVTNAMIDLLFDAAVEATEEAIVNALVAAETTHGNAGITSRAIDHDLLRAAMAQTR